VTRDDEPRARHRFDPGAPVAGLFFLAVAVFFVVDSLHHDPLVPPEYLASALFVGLGAVGIVRVLTRGFRRGR
jgi:hypothetical protein